MTPGIREAMRVSRATVNGIQTGHINYAQGSVSYLSNAACLLLGRCIVARSCQL